MAYFVILMVSATPGVITSPSGDTKNICLASFRFMFEDACNALDQKRNGMMEQMRRRKRIPDPTIDNDFLKTLIENGLLTEEGLQLQGQEES